MHFPGQGRKPEMQVNTEVFLVCACFSSRDITLKNPTPNNVLWSYRPVALIQTTANPRGTEDTEQ